jgi:transposase
MGPAKYVVNLSAAERDALTQLVRAGVRSARTLTRARVLLKADDGLPDPEVAAALDVGVATVHRIRQRCVEEGLEAALRDRPRPGAVPKFDTKQHAHVIALACSQPPEGRTRWTLRLLADRVVELRLAEQCSYETIRRALKKTLPASSSRGRSSSGASRRSGRRS